MTHFVVIIKDETNYKVANGRLKAEPGDTVRLYNYANDQASIVFKKDNPFGGNFKLKPGGGSRTQKNLEPGYYPYVVKVGDKEATASKPIIIVYPR